MLGETHPQERKAASFTVSPLHCGSTVAGFRASNVYGGEDGISLGTAVAADARANYVPARALMPLLNESPVAQVVHDNASGPTELRSETEAARSQRTAAVQQNYAAASPILVEYTNEVLFGQVWRRTGLAPRDRSLVTISALIASGKSAQLTSHLPRGLDNGITKAEASALIAHLAFYAGWPNAVSAAALAKTIFERRPN